MYQSLETLKLHQFTLYVPFTNSMDWNMASYCKNKLALYPEVVCNKSKWARCSHCKLASLRKHVKKTHYSCSRILSFYLITVKGFWLDSVSSELECLREANSEDKDTNGWKKLQITNTMRESMQDFRVVPLCLVYIVWIKNAELITESKGQ